MSSCTPLPPSLSASDLCVQVGIHIADVSRFVPEASPLDGAASQRHATQYLRVPSTFGQQPCDNTPAAAPPAASNLVAIAAPISGSGAEGSVCYSSQQILRIPMLPPDVSEACSLNPNVDRYAVTVVFVVSEEVQKCICWTCFW